MYVTFQTITATYYFLEAVNTAAAPLKKVFKPAGEITCIKSWDGIFEYHSYRNLIKAYVKLNAKLH